LACCTPAVLSFGKHPSLVLLPIGILPHRQSLHAMPFKASHKRKDFDLRSGVAQPAFARYALPRFLAAFG